MKIAQKALYRQRTTTSILSQQNVSQKLTGSVALLDGFTGQYKQQPAELAIAQTVLA